MTKLAIRGHETRGKEVIEILEMLGGKTSYECGYKDGFDSSYFFFIDKYFYIDGFAYNSEELEDCYIFTLEEFLEKFPYKVGDKVYNIIHNENQTITKVVWDFQENEVIYQTNDNKWVYVNYLQPLKEEIIEGKITMNENKGTLVVIDLTDSTPEIKNANEIEVILGDYEFVLKDGKTYFVKKNKYPKTYEECARLLNTYCGSIGGYNWKLLSCFQQLLICRDAYWKLAGEWMGLGKPWEPNWSIYEHKFCLGTDKDKVIEECVTTGNRILAFPTKEMRDAFYEYFKDLIESCKELL